MISFWEQSSFCQYDHIVIGAGIVGLNVSLELRKRFPQQGILVLERGFFPSGASTKNAGFACMGSLTELIADSRDTPEDAVVSLFKKRKEGLALLRARLGDERIDYQAYGSYELISEDALSSLQQMEHWNRLLYPVIGQDAFLLCNEKIKSFGFNSDYTRALIENTCEGAIDTGKMMQALIALCRENDIEIKTGAEVLRIEEEEKKLTTLVVDPLKPSENIPLQCSKLWICTNAFSARFFPDVPLEAGRGQVCITAPIEKLPFKGTFHFEEGYFYFRTIGQRVLFGGGRNLDFATEASTEFELNQTIQDTLTHYLREIILPDTAHTIEQRWAGIMAFGEAKTPIVRSYSDKIYTAFRLGGMGVALGTGIARDLVALMDS